MRFISLFIRNFRSFSGKHRISFPQAPGLYILKGMNKDNPVSFGANAVGKSNLWDSICWCLFGKTSRGLRATNVVSWGYKYCQVFLTFEIEGKTHTVKREQNPNEILLNDKVANQSDIDDLLCLHYDEFLACVLLGQFNRYFFDNQPAERLSFFSQLLGLNYWSELTNKAKDVSASIERKLVKLREDSVSFASKKIEIKNTISKLRGILKENEETTKAQLVKLEDDVDELNQRVKTANKDLTRAIIAIKDIDDNLKEATESFQLSKELVDTYREKLIRLMQLKQSADTQLGKIKETAPLCSLCLQPISELYLQDLIERHNKRTKSIERKRIRLQNLMDKYKIGQSDADSAIRELEDQKQRLVEIRNRVDNEILSMKQMIKTKREEISRWETIRKRSSKNLRRELTDCTNSLHKYTIHAKEINNRVKSLSKELAGTTYWVNGFKELRLWLIDSVTLEFEIATANNLVALGLSDWIIKYDVEKLSTTGRFIPGFHISIISPNNDEPVDWNNWSGGETQRLRIAGATAMASLISNRKGVFPEVEIWDEPTTHLSPEGVDHLLECLRSRADNKQIWVVDHTGLAYSGFDYQYLITKKNGVSKWAGEVESD